tara:strand:+ start:846 stop:1454 length:609 start_codon:yes stop_codon:yes gene_type:complete
MNNVKKTIILPLFIVLSSAFANAKYHIAREQAQVIEVTKSTILLQTINISPTELLEIEVPIKQLDHFLHDIGMRESSNRYTIVNKWGYAGKYQFGRRTLDKLGYKNITTERFLKTPSLQERAMRDLLKHNRHILRRQIRKHSGRVVHGILITESGLLAGSHLAGPGNVKRWLRTGKDKLDGLGTPLTHYIKLFSGYNLTSLE